MPTVSRIIRIALFAFAFFALLAGCERKEESNAVVEADMDAEANVRPAVELFTLDCGTMEWADLGVFSDEGAYDGIAGTLVDPCYLVRHPQGDLLWDLGLPESFAESPEGIAFPQMSLTAYVSETLSDQLAELELGVDDIEYISLSHSHFDHIGNGNLFAEHATWIVDAEEYEFAFRPEAREQPGFPNYSALEDADRILIEGDDDFDVFGDGSVVIIQAPGHTPGHNVLMVTLAEAGPVILTGDLWHIAESRPERRVPGFNTDRDQTLASMDKIEALADVSGARVVLQHVPEAFEAMPGFPTPLK